MASASHDIRLRGSTLALLNVPFWRTSEESLIERFARTGQPEEFQSGEDHINVDVADVICGLRRFLGDSGPGPWQDTPHARLFVAGEVCDRHA
jgi:hypothetical protein